VTWSSTCMLVCLINTQFTQLLTYYLGDIDVSKIVPDNTGVAISSILSQILVLVLWDVHICLNARNKVFDRAGTT